MHLKKIFLFIFSILIINGLVAQIGDGDSLRQFTHCDSLRGTLTDIRTCYDVTYYDLQVKVNPSDSSIVGSVGFYYNVVSDFNQGNYDWVTGDASGHGVHGHMNLYEGNVNERVSFDYTHGSASGNTIFRNHIYQGDFNGEN